MSNTSLKSIIEGFIFASDKAMSVDRVIGYFPENEEPEKADVLAAIEELQKDYEDRGIELKKVSTGYRFQVRQELTPWVSRLWEEKPARYTRALLETLALIVYRQPITRGEIEEIRGVAVSSNIIKTLQEREWVRVIGHRDVPGRPALYASTKEFLDYFNLESLEQLPPLSEIKDLDAIAKDLDPEKSAELIEAINEMKEAAAEEQNEAEANAENTEEGEETAELSENQEDLVIEGAADQAEVESSDVASQNESESEREASELAEDEVEEKAEQDVSEFVEHDTKENNIQQDARSENETVEADSYEEESVSDYHDGDTAIVDEEPTHG